MRVTRIDAARLDRRLEGDAARRDASRTAQGIIAEAEAEAERIRAHARRDAAARRDEIATVSDAQLAKFVDRTRLESAAETMLQVTAESGRLTDRFDALGPWVADLVETALGRILGDLPPEDLRRGVVAHALSEARADWELTMRVAPGDLPALRTALSDSEGRIAPRFSAIGDLIADRRLTAGTCLLVSGHGAVDISIETQVSVLVGQIRQIDGRRTTE